MREDFGFAVVELTPVHTGADLAADVWKALTTDSLYAVKWSGGGTDAGPLAAAYLADRGVKGVPAPVRTRDGQLWSMREGRRLTVAPWVKGRQAAETGLSDEQWTAYGVLLAEVHSTGPSEQLQRVLPRLNPINARMPALARQLHQRLTTAAPADEIEAELADVWAANHDTIARLLELAATLQPPQTTRVICHADPHLGNVITTGTAIHLIDWDDVVLAPREQDLLFLLGGMGSLGPTSPAQREAFFAGYGPVELDPDNLQYYRHARALEDVALWAEQAITGPDRADSLTILRGVLGPDGLAPKACSSQL
ncbi:phosphotransferase enzyme family protein [Kribbella flavida]|nr:phosphotransferase [Kribbella flavida]